VNADRPLSGLGLAALGVGLLVGGGVLFAVARLVIHNDALLRGRAHYRWLLVGRLKPAVWDRSETKEVWIERFVRRQRWLLTWIYPILALAWVVVCLTLIVGGLRGT
jgi:hypothetical protein